MSEFRARRRSAQDSWLGVKRAPARPGAEKYASRPEYSIDPLVEEANKVPVHRVLSDRFDITVPPEAGSWKVDCPFRREHADGGRLDKNCRYYGVSNIVYCFEMHGVLSPVALVARDRNWSYRTAAKFLVGQYRPSSRMLSYRERVAALQGRRSAPATFDSSYAVRALLTAVDSPRYRERQYDPSVISAVDMQVQRLALVSADELESWLVAAAAAIREEVER